MSSPEQYDSSAGQRPKEWELLARHVRRQIDRTSVGIEFADEVAISKQVITLNHSLEEEGLLDLSIRVRTSLPAFHRMVLTEDGFTEEPFIDSQLMKQTSYEGKFKGCSAIALKSREMSLLFYDIEMGEGEERITLRAPVDDSDVQITYPEVDEWEEEIGSAFAVLETVEDEEYREAVNGLLETFWNTNQPEVIRLRSIGLYACELLAHPEHAESKELHDALGVILLGSVEEGSMYEVKGFHANEVRLDDKRPRVEVVNSQKPRLMEPQGVKYVTNFEIYEVDGDFVDIKLGDTLQPALTFFDVNERVEFDYPMRYLARVVERDSAQLDAAQHQTRQVGELAINRWSQAESGETCGEWTHRYSQKYADGV